MAQEADNTTAEQLPLHDVVLCCTALPQDVRLVLSEVASRMGADFKLDLTTDVTHLIVGSITTPKYRYVAKDRPDIKVVSMDWLEAVRQAYMNGDDVDVVDLEEKHKLGVFHGLKICVTGFDNLEKRTFISETVVQQGAEYQGDLTKAVTHLIAAAPTGAKYTHAKAWKTHVVSWKWFKDSLGRGMALDESLYDPALPEEEQGQGATGMVGPRVSLGKRTRDNESQTTSDMGSRKLRRTASTRLHSQSQDMWQGLSTRDDASATLVTDQWKEEAEPKYAPQRRPGVEKVQVRQSDVFSVETTAVRDGVFSGCYVFIQGFPRNRATRLQHFLQPHGATVVKTVTELEESSRAATFLAGYLLMPHAFSGSQMEPPEVPGGTRTVTEWWVERCLHTKKLIDPANDALSQPLWHAEIADFTGLSICTTGFSGVDFRQTAEAIKLMGAEYAEKLMPSVSVLVSGSESVKKEKAYYAAKHDISVVSADWLWECLRLKRKLEYVGFAVKLPAFDATETVGHRSTASPASRDVRQSKSERPVSDLAHPPKRKNRPLGRSASGIGNRPISASAQHPDHAGGSPGLLPSETTDSAADGFANFSKGAPLPPPSTQLGYETADAEAHRLVMEKKMKVSLQDESSGTRVASVGMVRDSFVTGAGGGGSGSGEAGVGSRLRGRHRTKI
ncbi:hypothetical protein B0A55_12098 [Friedmanniomyces simplex]|uniref:BRCT domain-containing protein n=1 Tax=Friedmanniomyces simplex TaxID=329884 RepID=A0A4U0WI85_9PEZI|nr:hypothetical protein B0A55_12098 [Friedmanniomyces simplex]